MTVYTIGHSNRKLEEFIYLLRSAKLNRLVDVRAYPNSRRHPQYESTRLRSALANNGINYVWKGQWLGGFRRERPGSPHRALTSASLRAYADYMQTTGFHTAVKELMVLADTARLALMCAEKDPLRCHRSMIADYLNVIGVRVFHLIDEEKGIQHRLSALARREGNQLFYDRCEAAQLTVRI